MPESYNIFEGDLYMKCPNPHCNSEDVIKKGKTNLTNIQRYHCKKCNLNFSERDGRKNRYKALNNKRYLPICKKCNTNKDVIKFGKTFSGKQRYKCKVCQITFSYDK